MDWSDKSDYATGPFAFVGNFFRDLFFVIGYIAVTLRLVVFVFAVVGFAFGRVLGLDFTGAAVGAVVGGLIGLLVSRSKILSTLIGGIVSTVVVIVFMLGGLPRLLGLLGL